MDVSTMTTAAKASFVAQAVSAFSRTLSATVTTIATLDTHAVLLDFAFLEIVWDAAVISNVILVKSAALQELACRMTSLPATIIKPATKDSFVVLFVHASLTTASALPTQIAPWVSSAEIMVSVCPIIVFSVRAMGIAIRTMYAALSASASLEMPYFAAQTRTAVPG
jgi:hypothetical protein